MFVNLGVYGMVRGVYGMVRGVCGMVRGVCGMVRGVCGMVRVCVGWCGALGAGRWERAGDRRFRKHRREEEALFVRGTSENSSALREAQKNTLGYLS